MSFLSNSLSRQDLVEVASLEFVCVKEHGLHILVAVGAAVQGGECNLCTVMVLVPAENGALCGQAVKAGGPNNTMT